MHSALVAIHQDRIPVERLCRDAICMNDQWQRQGTGHNGRVRPH